MNTVTRRSALISAAALPAMALLVPALTPASYIAEIREAGLHIAPWEKTYSVGNPDGMGQEWFEIAQRYRPAVEADPEFHRRVGSLLRSE